MGLSLSSSPSLSLALMASSSAKSSFEPRTQSAGLKRVSGGRNKQIIHSPHACSSHAARAVCVQQDGFSRD